jgi:hypothetical protein
MDQQESGQTAKDIAAVRWTPARFAAVCATAIWLNGFGLAFYFKPGTAQIWIPDALLLLGFLPLLFVWKPFWPWVVFGLLNIAISFVLYFIAYLPDAALPANMLAGKHHIQAYHVPFVWLAFGNYCLLYGVFRLLKNLGILVFKRFSRRP